MTRRSAVLTAGYVVVVLACAALSRLWTDTDSAWCRGLDEPAWQPPDAVFGIIWPVNFLALLVVGVLVSLRHADVAARALGVLAVSVVLALGWSYLSSQEHLLVEPANALVLAAALTWVLLGVLARAGKGYALALVVYAARMTLAASLALGNAVLN